MIVEVLGIWSGRVLSRSFAKLRTTGLCAWGCRLMVTIGSQTPNKMVCVTVFQQSWCEISMMQSDFIASLMSKNRFLITAAICRLSGMLKHWPRLLGMCC
ncbi:hypothetical protein A9513_004675 [Pseudomonas sp. AU12215]|nr:hypothetical protein A9513_004675 [Pseudomonas sp. AU12215]